MDIKLLNKVHDFTEWTSLAFEHFNNDRFSDALTNMRKSGEAASKLIVFQKYPGQVGEYKAQKSYKELINLLTDENLVPRKVINWLETFQIHGNIATHDNQIVHAQAGYGNMALMLLAVWLFREHLNKDIPIKLKNFMDQERDDKKLREQAEFMQSQLNIAQKESQKLKQALEISEEQSKKNFDDAEVLKRELQAAQSKIEDLEPLKQKTSQLDKKLQSALKEAGQLKIQQQQAKQTEVDRAATKSHIFQISSKKMGITIGILLLLGFIGTATWLYPFWKDPKKENQPVAATEEKPFTVLILPFSVLQDNPNIIVKLEDAILRRLIQKIEDKKLFMEVHYRPEEDKPAVTYKQAFDIGKKQKADIVIFGEIYEQASGDSVQANIKYALLNEDSTKQLQGSAGITSFATLTDIHAGKLQDHIVWIIDMAIAYNLMNQSKHTEALVLLNKIIPVTDDQKYSLSDLKATCYNATGKYYDAKSELEKMLIFYPHNAYVNNFLGVVSIHTGNYDQAEKAFKKAIELDSSKAGYLLNYADLLCYDHIKNYNKAKKLTLAALQKAPSSSTAFFYLAEIEMFLMDYQGAKTHYLKTLELDSLHTSAKTKLAEVLAYHFNRLEEAVSYLNEVIKKDSANQYAHELLGNIFANSRLKDLEKARHHFHLSKKYQTSVGANTWIGLGFVAHDKKDYKAAEEYYLKALQSDTANLHLLLKIIQLYSNLKRYDELKTYLDKAYQLDSLNFTVNYDYGMFCYMAKNTQYYDEKKGQSYFEKALQIYPNDVLTLQFLGEIYYRQAQYVRAKKNFLNILKIKSGHYRANMYLGSIAEKEEDKKKAKRYYEKAMSGNAGEVEPYIGLSMILSQEPFNNYDLALHYAQKAADLKPKVGEYHYKIAQVFYLTGKISKAQKHYYQAVQLDPNLKNEEFEKSLP